MMNQAIIKGTEFFLTNDKLMVVHNGSTTDFESAPLEVLDILNADLERNPLAETALDLLGIHDPIERLRKYAECRYGAYDETPDFLNGKPQPNDEVIICQLRSQCPANGKLCVDRPRLENLERLSQREIEVVKYLGDGLTTQQIADKMFVCDAAIRQHIMKLKHKLDIATHAGLGVWASKIGLA